MYNADGIADSVDFVFRSAIRGSPYTCPDEATGCDYTSWVECAINGKKAQATTDQKVKFITCWDESSAGVDSRAQECSESAGLSWDAVSACHSGSEVDKLLAAAKDNFAAKWPQYTAAGGPYHVPHVLANGKDLDDISKDSIIKELCSAGISAAVCSVVV